MSQGQGPFLYMRDLLNGRYPRLTLAVAGIAGALGSLAFAPIGVSPLGVLAPLVLYLLVRAVASRTAFLTGWAYGFGFLGLGVFWLHISIAQFGGVNLPLAILLTLLFSAAMALYYGLAAWGAVRLVPEGAWRIPVFAGCWVLAEWVRGWFLSGFPWLALGYGQLGVPVAGYGPVFGVLGISLVLVLSAGLLVYWRRLWAAPLLLLLWVGGFALQQVEWTEPAGKPFLVSVVQGNFAQAEKWKPEMRAVTLKRYTDLTRRSGNSKVVIWPETAIPAFAQRVERNFFGPLEQELARAGTEVLLGVPMQGNGEDYYNSLLKIGPGKRERYDKRHLVPFGEFMPLDALLRPLIDLFQIPLADFSAGAVDQPLVTLGGQPVGLSICYEDAFGMESRESLPRATWLVNATNDAWFGDSWAPHQHLEIARMRALESGRPLVRATNTGISAFIDHKGRLAATAPQFEVAVLTAEVQPRQGRTPYIVWGDWMVVGICLLLIGAPWLARRMQSSRGVAGRKEKM